MKKRMSYGFRVWLMMVFWVCLRVGVLPAQAATGLVVFAETKHEFGDVKEEAGKITHKFTFTNQGKADVQITEAKTSCGCTVSDWTKTPVPPGGTGEVKVTFDPVSRPGLFAKDIVVLSTGKVTNHMLKISGKVLPRPKGPQDYYPFEEGMLRFKTNHLTYGRVFKDESVTLSTIVYNQGSKPVKFIPSKSRVPGHLKPVLSKLELQPGDTGTIFVTYNGALKDDWGFAFDNILLATTDAGHPLKKLNISAALVERFPKSGPEAEKPPRAKFDKTEIDLGNVTEGQFPVAVFTITNTGGHPLKFRKVSSGCSCIIPALSSTLIAPGETATISAKFNTRGRVGMQEKEVVVITNDPAKAETTLRITADVHRSEPAGNQ